MPYRPSYGAGAFGSVPLLAAIVPASMIAAICGVSVLGVLALASMVGTDWAATPMAVLNGLFYLSLMLVVSLVAATFVTAFYLTIFGLPVAWMLGKRIRHRGAWLLILPAILASAAFASHWLLGDYSNQMDDWRTFDPIPFVIVLGFALPAGFFYRQNVISMLDEAELD